MVIHQVGRFFTNGRKELLIMFEKSRAKKVVSNALSDANHFFKQAPSMDVYLQGGVTVELLGSLFIAFCDFYLFLKKNPSFGDLVVDTFLDNVQFKDLTRGLIVDAHKEYHKIVQECIRQNNSPEGLAQGYREIAKYIGETLKIEKTNNSAYLLLEKYIVNRIKDINRI